MEKNSSSFDITIQLVEEFKRNIENYQKATLVLSQEAALVSETLLAFSETNKIFSRSAMFFFQIANSRNELIKEIQNGILPDLKKELETAKINKENWYNFPQKKDKKTYSQMDESLRLASQIAALSLVAGQTDANESEILKSGEKVEYKDSSPEYFSGIVDSVSWVENSPLETVLIQKLQEVVAKVSPKKQKGNNNNPSNQHIFCDIDSEAFL